MVSRMTISSYQVENILKAYSKQDKARVQPSIKGASSGERYLDTVSLSSGQDKTGIYNRISYNLLDIIVKGKQEG
jgi:hypothetical protein